MSPKSVTPYEPFDVTTMLSEEPEFWPEGEVQAVNYADVHGEVLGVTPEMARFYLDHNNCNRPLSQQLIANYARAMVQGRWHHANGEPIIFGSDDSLLDGQHRLHAILRSKMTIGLMVVTGVDPRKRASIDTGRKRTFGNYLSMLGYKDSTTLAAALAWLHSYATGVIADRGPSSFFVSHEDALSFLCLHPKLIDSVCPGRSMQPFYTPGCGVFLHYLFALINPELANMFASSVHKGVTAEESQPFYVLRERLIKESAQTRGSRKKVALVDLAVYGVRAWNAHRQGRHIRILRWSRVEPNIEPFPDPI